MTLHTLKATRHTVHLGGFSDKLKPVLEINSGDTVEIETYNGFYVYDQAPPEFLTPEFIDICEHLAPALRIASGPHLLTGPIAIRDAKPGDVLEVRLLAIAPLIPMGYNIIRPGWGALPDRFADLRVRFLALNLERQTAEFPPHSNIQIPLRPFFGILGVATPESARSSVPPGAYGGNMDLRHLQVGSRLFLPVFVPDALFSAGDGHSAQGDGEIDVSAIETSVKGSLQLTVRQDLPFTAPIAETPTHWITLGFGETLDAAFEDALTQMIRFLVQFLNLAEEDAYVLCSLAIDFHITQVVNRPQKGVHGMLPKSILPQPILV
jgi:acetamidase/formamidase